MGRVEQTTNISVPQETVDTMVDRNLLKELVRRYELIGIKFAIVPIAQSSIETAWWTSKIWEENRNGWGMKYNNRGHAVGVNRGHAKYTSSAQSLLDYKVWQQKCLKLRPDINTEEEYIQMLDNLPLCKGCRYAEDPIYTDKVRDRVRLLREMMEE